MAIRYKTRIINGIYSDSPQFDSGNTSSLLCLLLSVFKRIRSEYMSGDFGNIQMRIKWRPRHDVKELTEHHQAGLVSSILLDRSTLPFANWVSLAKLKKVVIRKVGQTLQWLVELSSLLLLLLLNLWFFVTVSVIYLEDNKSTWGTVSICSLISQWHILD